MYCIEQPSDHILPGDEVCQSNYSLSSHRLLTRCYSNIQISIFTLLYDFQILLYKQLIIKNFYLILAIANKLYIFLCYAVRDLLWLHYFRGDMTHVYKQIVDWRGDMVIIPYSL